MKARTFRTKTRTSQTAYEGMRRRAGMRAGALRAVRMAKVTMVMMPERRGRSARIQTAKVVTNWMMTEVATSRIRPTMNSKRRDKTAPTSTLPRDTTASNGSADQAEKLPATAAATARRYTSSALASLKRLTPSRMTSSRCGGRICLSTAVAAAASGGATMAPRAIAAGQGKPGTQSLATAATAPMVAATAATARPTTARQYLFRSRGDE